MKRKSHLGWFFLLGLLLAIFVLHKPILEVGTGVLLRAVLPKGGRYQLDYDKSEWKEGKLVISGLRIAEEAMQLTADRVEMSCGFDLLPFYIEPRLLVVHPELTLVSQESTPQVNATWAGLIPAKFYGVKADVQNGVVQFYDGIEFQRLYFIFKSGEGRNKIGALSLSCEPDQFSLPLVLLELERQDKNLACAVKIQQGEVQRLVRLIGVAIPELKEGWQEMQGEVELAATALMQLSGELSQLSCEISAHNFVLANARLGLQAQADALQGEFSYPAIAEAPIWKRVRASAAIKGGELILSAPLVKEEWGLKNLEGNLELDPSLDPQLNLQGDLARRGETYPLNINGKGFVNDDQTFWLELALRLQGKSAREVFLSLCSSEKGAYVVQTEVKNFGRDEIRMAQDILTLAYERAASFEIAKGSFSGKATAWLKHGAVQELHIEKIAACDVAGAWGGNVKGNFNFLELEGRFEQGVLVDLKGHLAGGRAEHEKNSFTELESDFHVEKGAVQPSWIKGVFLGMRGKIAIHPPTEESDIDITLNATCAELITHLFPELKANFASAPVSINAAIKLKEGGAGMLGTFLFDGSEKLDFGLDLKKNPLALRYELIQGWFRSEKISPLVYAPVLKWITPEIALKGDLDLCGTFDSAALQLSLQGDKVIFTHPLIELSAPAIGEKDAQLLKTEGRAQLNYDFKKQKWHGTIPIVEARLVQNDIGLAFDHVHTLIKLDGPKIAFEDLSAKFGGLQFKGSAALHLIDAKSTELHLSSSHIEGSLDSLRQLLHYFPHLPHLDKAVQGDFTVGEKEFALYAHLAPGGDKISWQFKTNVHNLGCALNPQLALKNLHCTVDFDSHRQTLIVSNTKGELHAADGKAYTLKTSHFQYQPKSRLEFDCSLYELDKEIVRLAGKAEEKGEAVHFSFEQGMTHILATPLQISQLVIKNNELEKLSAEPLIKGSNLLAQAQLLKRVGLLDLDLELIVSLALEGQIQTKFSCVDKRLAFQAEGKHLRAFKKSIGLFTLKGQKHGPQWIVEKLQADDFNLSFAFTPQRDTIPFTALELKFPNFTIRGDGTYRKKERKLRLNFKPLNCSIAQKKFNANFTAHGYVYIDFTASGEPWTAQGELSLLADLQQPLVMQVENEGLVKFNLSPTLGLKLQGINFAADEAFVRVEQLHYDMLAKQWRAAQVSFCLPPTLLQEFDEKLELEVPLFGLGDAEFGESGVFFQASLKDLRFKTWDLKQIGARYEHQVLNLVCRTAYEQLPLFAQLQMDFTSEPLGMLKLMDATRTNGLKALFKLVRGKTELHSVQGALAGLDVDLVKHPRVFLQDAHVLMGTVKIDPVQIGPLLSAEAQRTLKKFKLGPGYCLDGKWTLRKGPFHFKGNLLGTNLTLMGYQFSQLEAQTEITPEQVLIQNLNLSDPAGNLTVRHLNIEKEEGEWNLELPLLQVQNLKPSLLRKQSASTKPQKPLLIKNLSLINIRGTLGKISSFTGKGHLNFTNTFRKEASFFDIPLKMLKDLGLDPGLLTPINGEADLLMHGDKFYLTALENAYSEGHRSIFFLDDRQESYLDLDGNLHIGLKLKQDAVLKIAEPFTLNVRGNWEKPQYFFK